MRSHRSLVSFLVSSCLIATTPLFAAGPERINQPVAIATTSMSSVQWQPQVDNDGIHLTITTPNGASYARDFRAGTTPILQLKDLPADAVTDGSYTWELRVTPRIAPEIVTRLQTARAAGDDTAIAQIRRDAGLGSALVQSGGFRVTNGSLVSSSLTESSRIPAASSATSRTSSASTSSDASAASGAPLHPVTNDNVIADDLIVQGSACVGLDCVNNESFGFDTILLKENNTRIHFFDDSTGAGFPNEQWQLTANDSASGGLNKFSIDDITAAKTPMTIEGNAPTNSLYVNASGKVGLRTATPALDLHILTGNTPAMRYEQDGTSGFSAQTWDIGANEANFFVRDVTGGSRLPFRIRPGAPTSSVDISATGNVGIGTAAPQYKVDVQVATSSDALSIGGVQDPGLIFTTNSSNSLARNWGLFTNRYSFGDLVFNTSVTNASNDNPYNGTFQFVFTRAGNLGLGVKLPANPIQHSNGAFLSTGGVWTNASSREYKQDIAELQTSAAMEALDKLDPVTYAYKVDPSEHHVGFIAEDVPELVATKDRKSLSPMDVVAVLTKVVQEQQKTMDEQQKTIDEMKTRLEQLEKNVD